MTGTELSIETHRVRVMGDTVLTRYIGVLEYQHVVAVHGHLDRVKEAHGRLFVINDMRQSGIPSSKARRFIAQWGANNPGVEVVNFGASLTIRVLQRLLLRAVSLMQQQPAIIPEHAADEAAAYAWARRGAARRGAAR